MNSLAYDQRYPLRIADLYDQAESRKAQGCYADAEKLYQNALAVLVPNHADSAPLESWADAAVPQNGLGRRIRLIKLQILSAVGDLYRLQGRYRDAERLLRTVAAACDELAGPSDGQTAAALINLGVSTRAATVRPKVTI